MEFRVTLFDASYANIFLDTGSLPHGSNSSFFTLIPKIFSHEQSAFIAGRQILDGPLILSEIVEWFKKKKKKLLIFKVDFEKAFDSVSWRYLDFVLFNLGFGSKWCSWIRACLSLSRASVLVNVSSGLIKGVKFDAPEVTISHQFYVDDVIITTKWNANDLDNIIRVLQVFYLASGLKINIHKFNVYGIVVSDVDVSSMASNSGCFIGQVQSKLSLWKANLLSIGGLHTLIKAVLGILGVYYFLIFKVKVVKALHGQEGGFDNNGCIHNNTWGRIVGSYNFLHSNNIILNSSFRFQAGCGTRIRFWKDTWVGDSPFYIQYNRLYRLEREKDCLINDRIDHGQWRWNWSRPNLSARNFADLLDMLFEISSADLNKVEDSCVWSLGADGTFFCKGRSMHC
ncbi:putative RNA-directed DNA polymerase, eukaryota, reverse transcriptase zinc-binding domain protein [Tanacetum coccineum]